MADILSLEQLVHLSLGDPEAGAVNFNVLKTLLLQMLKAMNLFNYKPTMSDHDQRTIKEALLTHQQDDQANESDDTMNEPKAKSRRKKRDRNQERLNNLEEKVSRFESQLNALNEIPSNTELIDRTKQLSKKPSDDKTTNRQGPILEVWQYTQMEKRLESAENGITRLASLLQDLIGDMNDLKDSHETIKQTTDELKNQQEDLKSIVETLNREKNDWAKKSDIENLDEKIQNLQNLLTSLRDRLDEISKKNNDLIEMPDLNGFVTWDRLEDALKGIRESLEKSSNDAAIALASARDNRSAVQFVERQSQTSAKRKSSTQDRRPLSGDSSGAPSDNLGDLLEQLGTLNNRHEQLKALVEALERKKLNRDEFDTFKNQHNDLFDRLAVLERDFNDIKSKRMTDNSGSREISTQQRTDYSGDISDFRTALQRLREDLDRLKQSIQDLINQGNLSSQDIDALKKLIEQLEQTKADKNRINNELDKKADKQEVENRVLKKDFNSTCNELSQNINDCMQKFNVHDDIQKQDLEKVNHDIDGKLDRTELDALRDYMDKQLKKLKKLAKEQQTQQHVHLMSEDEAAGLRKQLIRFHCISCDRPIDVQPHPQQASLPASQGMRPIQSPRPYTTYELDQIRQFQKSQQFSNELSGGVADVYATIRQCGGSHTMTLPFKRQIKTQPVVPEETLLSRSEVDIKGHDGVIYKGRIDAAKLPTVDMQKKNSVVLLAPPPLQRPRSEIHPMSAPPQSINNEQEQNATSTIIPNPEPNISREQTFT